MRAARELAGGDSGRIIVQRDGSVLVGHGGVQADSGGRGPDLDQLPGEHPGGAARRKEAAAVKSLVIKLPKKISREAGGPLGSARVGPGPAGPLPPEAGA